MEWDTLAKENGLKNAAPKIIADDVLMYEIKDKQILVYLRKVLDVLKHYQAKLKPKKVNMVSRQVQVFKGWTWQRAKKTLHSPKMRIFQARATKYTGRPPHAHWNLRILQLFIAPV